MMFTHPQGIPDDSFHASFYAWFASRVMLGIPIDPTMGMAQSLQISGANVEGYGTVL